ncbi:MAG: polysaccharide deacetylase family protein [Bdellovibrionaceae bacterium]|nr:polysaccharide deacetylase family protein [Pseudobdellovibrionaceae bacterium]
MTGNRFDKGFWAITLDDGPHATHTAGMINTIQGAGMKATFFWLSQNLTKYPSLVSQAGMADFDRASHSFTHANLPKLGPVGLKHEIDDAVHAFTKEVGSPPTFFRCPYGACGGNNSQIRTMIANKNMMHVFWNVDSLDWQDQNPQTIFERTKKQIDILGRGIILLHDIHPQSVEAMKLIVPYLKKIKAQVKTLSEMMLIETGKVYPSP